MVELEFKNRKLKTKLAFKTGPLERWFEMFGEVGIHEMGWEWEYNRGRALDLLDLIDGQFFADYEHKNHYWILDGEYIGYGDLSADNVIYISEMVSPGHVFQAFPERLEVGMLPTIEIRLGDWSYPRSETRKNR